MTEEQIKDGNIVIASFMGGIVDELHVRFDKNKFVPRDYMLTHSLNSLEFHKDWQWLMPVVNACYKTIEEYSFDSSEYKFWESHFEPATFSFLKNQIFEVWETCVNYIRQYEHRKNEEYK